MTNMSYCRFQNTVSDLEDCVDNWDEPRNDDEERARRRMIVLARKIVELSEE